MRLTDSLDIICLKLLVCCLINQSLKAHASHALLCLSAIQRPSEEKKEQAGAGRGRLPVNEVRLLPSSLAREALLIAGAGCQMSWVML